MDQSALYDAGRSHLEGDEASVDQFGFPTAGIKKQILLASPIRLASSSRKSFKRKDLASHRKQDIAQSSRRRSSRFDPVPRRKSVLTRHPSLVKPSKRRSSQITTKQSNGYPLSLEPQPLTDDYVMDDLFGEVVGERARKTVQDHLASDEALTPSAFPRVPFFTFKTPSPTPKLPSGPSTIGPKTPGEKDELMDLFSAMCRLRERDGQPKTPKRRGSKF